MNKSKKVLVGYDGSACADAALEDLKRAGLPAGTEVTVVTVADVFPAPGEYTEASLPEKIAIAAVKRGWDRVKESVAQAKSIAEKAAGKIKADFPNWQVRAEGFADSPSWGIVKKAQEWKTDLIVVGAHGSHAPSKLVLGSLSQLVATQASCSVRIVHKKPEEVNSPARIVIGVDGSAYSYEAIHEVGSREWKKGTAVHIITVTDPRMETALFSSEKALKEMLEKTPEDRWAGRLIDHAIHKLDSKGLTVTSFSKQGDPKKVLLEEAARWGADCIFVGARGLSGILHSLLGSVSASVVARANCTVEIVRARQA